MQLVNWKEILNDEFVQLQEEGKNVEALKEKYNSIEDTQGFKKVCEELYNNLDKLSKVDDYPYLEPSELHKIRLKLDNTALNAEMTWTRDTLYDRIYGAWLGRTAGCLLGKPVEGWPRSKISELLHEYGVYPLNHYFTNRYVPKDVETWMNDLYQQNAIELCKAMPRDDDMDYTILALKTIETYGLQFTSENIAEMWLTHLPPLMTYTAERAAYFNLCSGITIPEAAVLFNPYREWIGAQIRTDLYGYINPGNPQLAAEMAFRDAAVSHTSNGIYGAMFISAMNAAAFVESDIETIIRVGAGQIPHTSRLYEAIHWVLQLKKVEPDWERAGDQLLERFKAYHRVHTINNAGIVCLALLYGEGDFEKTITIATMMGLDTDCNAATAGSIIGILKGANSLPDKWIKPLHDQIESFIAGEGTQHISKLALRTVSILE